MPRDLSGQPAVEGRGWLARNKIVLTGVLLLSTFLIGYVPGYLQGQRLERELSKVRQEISLAELRDLAGLAYLQALQKDYGLAESTSTRLFTRMGEVARQTSHARLRTSLEELLRRRDPITARIATADAGVPNELQDLFVKTRGATAVARDGQQTDGTRSQ